MKTVWTKICGVRDERIVPLLKPLVPDAIGLNFYPQSARQVEPERAARIVRILPEGILPIGLFVNRPYDEIIAITKTAQLKTVQLHGHETVEFAGRLSDAGLQILRAFRVDATTGLGPVHQELDDYRRIGVPLWACLADASVSGAFGGTGHEAPWEILKEWRPSDPPLILAGGLTPQNVAAAVSSVRPFGVDVASGIEHHAGQQDVTKIQEFLAAANASTIS